MSSLDPQLIISASEMFMCGMSNSGGLQTILDYLSEMDIETQTVVIQNIRRGLEYTALYKDTETMKTLLRYLIPQVNQYTREMVSNNINIPSNLSAARTLASDIVYLNRYENFRLLLSKTKDVELCQLFNQTKTAIDEMYMAFDSFIKQAKNYVSISTRFSNLVSSLSAQSRHALLNARQFCNNFRLYVSTGATSITSGFAYLATAATTSYNFGIICTLGVYGLAGVAGVGLGASIHYSGIGEYIGTDYAGEKIGDFVFDLVNH